MVQVRRREFVTLIGGAAVAWPLGAGAQQGERVRRVGPLLRFVADDREGQARVIAFVQGLQQPTISAAKSIISVQLPQMRVVPLAQAACTRTDDPFDHSGVIPLID